MSNSLIKLNLGAGVAGIKGWINVDKYVDPIELQRMVREKDPRLGNGFWEEGAEYIQADIADLPFEDNYADVIEMHQVLEHISFRYVAPVLQEIYRVLKPGGKFIMDVPSFNGVALDWLNMVLTNSDPANFDLERYVHVMETVFGSQVHEGEFHKTAFTQPFLNYCLVAAGFTDGTFAIYSKGAPTPQIGELGRGSGYLRQDTLVATLTK